MAEIIDVSYACDRYASALKAAGVRTVFRYYTRDSAPTSEKRLSRAEALGLSAAGLRLCVVHEGRHGDQIDNFDELTGLKDGAYARTYAAFTIGQPAESAIYFGVDTDASAAEVESAVIPYFKGVAQAFAAATGEPAYTIGAYGSGATCQALLDAGLVKLTWLAQSSKWRGSPQFLLSGRWTLQQQRGDSIAGVDCDPSVAAEDADIGDFELAGAAVPPQAVAVAKTVTARSGLKLRSGPGTEFQELRLLPLGTTVHAMRQVGDWTLVSLVGDGAADGYVSSGFLSG